MLFRSAVALEHVLGILGTQLGEGAYSENDKHMPPAQELILHNVAIADEMFELADEIQKGKKAARKNFSDAAFFAELIPFFRRVCGQAPRFVEIIELLYQGFLSLPQKQRVMWWTLLPWLQEQYDENIIAYYRAQVEKHVPERAHRGRALSYSLAIPVRPGGLVTCRSPSFPHS